MPQIKDYSCRLDSVFGIFSFVGCVMAPEIVVFQEWGVFQQRQAPQTTSASDEKKKAFLTSARHSSATNILLYMAKAPVWSTASGVPSFLIKLATVADCDRTRVL